MSPIPSVRILEDSLRRLGTDYIDFYITHRQPAIEAIPAVMDTLLTFKKEGKIRGIGISNATPRSSRPISAAARSTWCRSISAC